MYGLNLIKLSIRDFFQDSREKCTMYAIQRIIAIEKIEGTCDYNTHANIGDATFSLSFSKWKKFNVALFILGLCFEASVLSYFILYLIVDALRTEI